jgi:hypothetical protein
MNRPEAPAAEFSADCHYCEITTALRELARQCRFSRARRDFVALAKKLEARAGALKPVSLSEENQMPDDAVERRAWLQTEAGKNWLRTAPLVELVARQRDLLPVLHTEAARAEYDVIERTIRGENNEIGLRTGPTLC